jgi:hypothetical protein
MANLFCIELQNLPTGRPPGMVLNVPENARLFYFHHQY